MEILLILIYAALCIAIFKIFRIPVNKWTLPTAALGGIVMIGFILLVMNYNHPFSANARIYFATTPIMPNVKGRVVEVPVQANAPLKQGDVLFRIDPSPYQFKVDKGRAALAEAEQNVGQLKAGYESAQASVDEATAQRDRAKGSYERYSQGNENARKGGRDLPFSLAEIENRRTTYLASEGALQAATAGDGLRAPR
jgi:multidrug resistance efflux pump